MIHGDHDEYGSVRFPDMICDLVSGPSVKKILVGGGHVPHKENEEGVLTMVQEFLG
ncbi:hydrolase-like hypothetical protein [Bdellovibrio bacteriovorus str. Tiberius]|uniref:Alpha/beta hydrolase n=1 Tax=Bdellovibrio bacteriovorus str. Tiberius TaxID=1069642 RepID=K7YSG5_BDEBC|nr:hydrolase-like hypothetical protein [Bdellovibrio bacteriovorus str. Tiberius]